MPGLAFCAAEAVLPRELRRAIFTGLVPGRIGPTYPHNVAACRSRSSPFPRFPNRLWSGVHRPCTEGACRWRRGKACCFASRRQHSSNRPTPQRSPRPQDRDRYHRGQRGRVGPCRQLWHLPQNRLLSRRLRPHNPLRCISRVPRLVLTFRKISPPSARSPPMLPGPGSPTSSSMVRLGCGSMTGEGRPASLIGSVARDLCGISLCDLSLSAAVISTRPAHAST
jgi:hypothetical protein